MNEVLRFDPERAASSPARWFPCHKAGDEKADVTTGIDALAPRQRQIVAGLWDGLSEKQVASQLQLSINTLHDYVKTIYRRLDVTTRTELISRMR